MAKKKRRKGTTDQAPNAEAEEQGLEGQGPGTDTGTRHAASRAGDQVRGDGPAGSEARSALAEAAERDDEVAATAAEAPESGPVASLSRLVEEVGATTDRGRSLAAEDDGRPAGGQEPRGEETAEAADPETPHAEEAGPEPVETTRRVFLQHAARAAVGAASVLATLSVARVLVPRGASHHDLVDLGRLVEYRPGTTTWVASACCFVVRNAAGVGVFSGRCTHLGCTVRRHPEGFACPCHGARFDSHGRVLSGPARRDLPWHPVWVEADGHLWVDLGGEQDAGTVAIGVEDTEQTG